MYSKYLEVFLTTETWRRGNGCGQINTILHMGMFPILNTLYEQQHVGGAMDVAKSLHGSRLLKTKKSICNSYMYITIRNKVYKIVIYFFNFYT